MSQTAASQHGSPLTPSQERLQRAVDLLPRRALGTAHPAAGTAAGDAQDGLDLVLYNGNVWTGGPALSGHQAVAVRDGRIVAVGSSDDLRGLAGPGTQEIDVDGGFILPGLVDSHMHPSWAALDLPNVDLAAARSVGEVVAAVGERCRTAGVGSWVRARALWHETMLEEGRFPTRWELDSVSADNPVFIPRGGHVCVANSRALELAGITRGTPDPAGGVVVRDASGEPTGLLLERARALLDGVLPQKPSGAAAKRLFKEQLALLNQLGYTSVTEAGVGTGELETYAALYADGALTVRMHLLYWTYGIGEVRDLVAAARGPRGNDWLALDGLKYILDGGIEGAALSEPYRLVPGEQEDPEYRGKLILPPGGVDELAQMFAVAAATGFQYQVHTVGDRSADLLAALYRTISERYNLGALRWVAVHLSHPTPAVLKTFRELGVPATVQDNAALLGKNQFKWWGPERAHAANPIRTILDEGLRVGGGTDAPVVPPEALTSLWWMVTRQMLQGGVTGPDQAIEAHEGLELFTSGSAYTQFSDRQTGTLDVGKYADIAVLDRSPLTVPGDEIRDIRCRLTVAGGQVVYDSLR